MNPTKNIFIRNNKHAMTGKAVILFTRTPEPGRVKTRMKPYLNDVQCAELHSCFLKDIAAELAKTGADIIVCYDTAEHGALEDLKSIYGRDQLYYPQSGSSLGERMNAALEEAFRYGYRSCLLMGSDIPEMRAEDITDAFDRLENSDVVIGPSADGGYWLIGMHRPEKSLFESKEYSHGSVLEELIHSASESGLTYEFAVTHQDMDTPDDLADYRQRMRRDRHLRNSHTGRYLRDHMSISVIVPVYNEASTIDTMVSQLELLRDQFEITIVDGGSSDGTIDHVPGKYQVIRTEKGRGLQMNAGARLSHGDILFFLHCDSELPPDPAAEIRRVMSRCEAGCFGIAFHSGQFFMWTNRVISNIRAGAFGVMFGDQGIFMTRELYDRLGGFPDIPIMEDYQLSLTLREMGIRPGMARQRIYTSDRRYPRANIPKLRLMHRMYRMRRAYRGGVPASELALQYRDIR